jgi:hypothetical protein
MLRQTIALWVSWLIGLTRSNRLAMRELTLLHTYAAIHYFQFQMEKHSD